MPKVGNTQLQPAPWPSPGLCRLTAKSGQKDCYCPFHRKAAMCPDKEPAARCPSQARAGISPRGHCYPPTVACLQPGHKLPSDRPQALRDACQSYAESSPHSPPSAQPGPGRVQGGKAKPRSGLADVLTSWHRNPTCTQKRWHLPPLSQSRSPRGRAWEGGQVPTALLQHTSFSPFQKDF